MSRPTKMNPEPRIAGLAPETRRMLAHLQSRIETMLHAPPGFFSGGGGNPDPELAERYDIIIDGFGIKDLNPRRSFKSDADAVTLSHLEKARLRIEQGQVAPPMERSTGNVHKMLEEKIPYEDRRDEAVPERVDGDGSSV